MITDKQAAEDFCTANPGQSVIVGSVHLDAAGVCTPLYKIAALQAAFGFSEYRLKVDALRRPDGETISKSMRQCIDELYEELQK